jgi:hypothetical protein
VKIAGMLRLRSAHSKEFDILEKNIDSRLSGYIDSARPNYVEKVLALYSSLDVEAAIWAESDLPPIDYVTVRKETIHVFEVEVSRVLAYIEETSWSAYIHEERNDFDMSLNKAYPEPCTVLVRSPLRTENLITSTTYEIAGGPKIFRPIRVVDHRQGSTIELDNLPLHPQLGIPVWKDSSGHVTCTHERRNDGSIHIIDYWAEPPKQGHGKRGLQEFRDLYRGRKIYAVNVEGPPTGFWITCFCWGLVDGVFDDEGRSLLQ